MEKLFQLDEVKKTLESTKELQVSLEEKSDFLPKLELEGTKIDNLVKALEEAVIAETLLRETVVVLREEDKLNKTNIKQAKVAIESGCQLLGIKIEHLGYSLALEDISDNVNDEAVAAIESADNIIVKFFKALWAFIKKIFKAIGDFFKKLWNFITGKGWKTDSERISKKAEMVEEEVNKTTKAIAVKLDEVINNKDEQLLEEFLKSDDNSKKDPKQKIEDLKELEEIFKKEVTDELEVYAARTIPDLKTIKDYRRVILSRVVEEIVEKQIDLGEPKNFDKVKDILKKYMNQALSDKAKEHAEKIVKARQEKTEKFVKQINEKLTKVANFISNYIGKEVKDVVTLADEMEKSCLDPITASVNNITIYISNVENIKTLDDIKLQELNFKQVKGCESKIFFTSLVEVACHERVKGLQLPIPKTDKKVRLSKLKGHFHNVEQDKITTLQLPNIVKGEFLDYKYYIDNIESISKSVNRTLNATKRLNTDNLTKTLKPITKIIEKTTKDIDKILKTYEEDVEKAITDYLNGNDNAIKDIETHNLAVLALKVSIPNVVKLSKSVSTDLIYIDRVNAVLYKLAKPLLIK